MKLPFALPSRVQIAFLLELLVVTGLFFASSQPARAGNLIVTVNSPLDTADATAGTGTCDTGGPLVGGQPECTLRAAIQTANVNSSDGVDEVRFAIAAANFPTQCTGTPVICTLSPASVYPPITAVVKIDGYTQSGASENTNATNQASNAVILIRINGSGVPGGFPILFDFTTNAGGSTLQGLRVHGMATGLATPVRLLGNSNVVRGMEFNANAGSHLRIEGDTNIIGGASPGDRNVLWGAGIAGIIISSTTLDPAGNTVQGNFIGIQPDGTAGGGLTSNAIQIQYSINNIIGGTTPGARNVISNSSASSASGISISGYTSVTSTGSTGNIVQGNYIGTDLTGTLDFGNTFGIWIDAAQNTVGGTVGLTPAGPCTGACNLISGNNSRGVYVSPSAGVATPAPGNVIRGNFIGSNAAGTGALGNSTGVYIGNSDDTQVIDNLISGNTSIGLNLEGFAVLPPGPTFTTDTIVRGNRIGVAADGFSDLGNTGAGINMSRATGSLIGGTSPGQGNIVAYNGTSTSQGVRVLDSNSTGNPILGNSIFGNSGLGIDLRVTGDSAGVTPNDIGLPHDTDTGGNNLQNFPVVASAVANGSETVVTASLQSAASTSYRIEYFDNASCHALGNGEGVTFLGTRNVTTDASGDALNFSHNVANLKAGRQVTATATRLDALLAPIETSEFSLCATVTAAAGPDTDQDGYSDTEENAISENPNLYCAIMRADVDHSGSVVIGDLAAVAGYFLQTVGPAPARYDQGQTRDNVINISDLAAMAGQFLKPVGDCPQLP